MIQFKIEDRDGTIQQIDIPEGINLNLMEVLKASDYQILATCGGMALCATCHIQVMAGGENLSPVSDAELDILDTLPSATSQSRLACQLKVGKEMTNTTFKICGELA